MSIASSARERLQLRGVALDVRRESPRSTSPASRSRARRRCGRRSRPRVAGTSMHARVARVALLLQEIGFQRLQVDRARRRARAKRGEQQREHASARARPAADHRRARWAAELTALRLGRAYATTMRGAGRARACRARRWRSVSTRACSPQVLASSCSWPYSTSSCARALLLALEVGEELARLVLRGDEPERAGDENQRGGGGSASPPRVGLDSECSTAGSRAAAVRSATRSAALRARGFAATLGAGRARAVPTILSSGCGISLARSGRLRGQLSGCAQRAQEALDDAGPRANGS